METSFDIEISNITKIFDKSRVLDEISLQVRKGEFLTLLGPSGCGKTTLLRLIAGFETPTSGTIVLAGQDVTNLPPYKRNVHTVFQQYALFPHRTVAGNIAFGLERRRLSKVEIKKKVFDSLDLVQLPGFEDRYPQQLSGGQQQRVAIARALVLEPKVLLLDEPLSALDMKLRKEMQVELKKLQRRLGIGFLFVTHDQQEALAMSDRIAVMNKGRIEQLGTGEEIYERPRTEFVADFIGVSNILTAKVVGREGSKTLISFGQKNIGVSHPNYSSQQELKVAVRPEKIHISSSKEEAFIVGNIDEKLYLGDTTHWRVRLENGSVITVFEQNRNRQHADLTPGTEVFLSWEQENSIILER